MHLRTGYQRCSAVQILHAAMMKYNAMVKVLLQNLDAPTWAVCINDLANLWEPAGSIGTWITYDSNSRAYDCSYDIRCVLASAGSRVIGAQALGPLIEPCALPIQAAPNG